MSVRKDLPEEVQEILKGKSVNLAYVSNKERYTKRKFLQIHKGYDFLAQTFVVRTYIQKRYNLNRHTLELLLILMGWKLFTRKMFSEAPRSFRFSRFNSFLEDGYINLVMDDDDVEKRIYTLSTKYRNIVIKYYHYMSGEEKIPEDSVHNPMANKNKQVAYDKKKLEMIKRLNKLEVPEHKRFMWD